MYIKSINFPIMTVAVAAAYSYLLMARAKEDNCTSDFSEVTRLKLFVDKTSFIEDYLKHGPKLMIIMASRKSGKSTIIDMLLRFLTVPVDSTGSRIPLNTTENYKLFCQAKLEICKNEKFVRNHMGQYPVIYINYHKLEEIVDLKTLKQQLGSIIFDTFTPHKYLAHNSSLFRNNAIRVRFDRYCNATGVSSLKDDEINHSFYFLSELLYKHFGRKVIILLDEYDAYCKKLLFKQIEEFDDVINFIAGLAVTSFENNNYIENAMLTGILRLGDVDVKPTESMAEYRWLGDHVFAKYYGLTMLEITKLIDKYALTKMAKRQISYIIKQYYSEYKIVGQKTKIYRLRPVLQFLKPI